MTNRERALAVLRFDAYDRLPIVHFGYWRDTLDKWAGEGHIEAEEAENHRDGNVVDQDIAARLGFDFNWQTMFSPTSGLMPTFEGRTVEQFADGRRHVLNADGVILVQREGATGIPSEVDHLLKDRKSWEEHYKWRYDWTPERIDFDRLRADAGGERENPLGLHCGSLFGHIRNVLGFEGVSYLYVDDEPLFHEIIDAVGDICFRNTQAILESGAVFDFAHFWEDICFKNGPLVSPSVFEEYVGPHYRRITSLVGEYGIDIVSLDCDGLIDALVPIWLDNGVNTMFPIEVGTWNASIEPWRNTYGKRILGVGGMNKNVFSRDRRAVENEIERLRRLVDLGGYIPCPDHRIAPDAEWDLVKYYCERMRAVFT